MTTLLAKATGNLERANHTVGVIGARLTNTQGDVVELRNKIAGLALLVTVDPAHEPELVDARTRLAQSETSMRELGAAEQLAQRMAREAQQRALQTSCISPKQRRG
jgi:hypothetical protein